MAGTLHFTHLTCDIGLYVRRLAPAMSVDMAPGISEWPKHIQY